MSRSFITRTFNPWKHKRQEQERRLAELRSRDGDKCRRCRRPMRFDLPPGHDLAARLEQVVAESSGGRIDIANLVLCHVRCNSAGADHTSEVTERIRRRSEAALLSKKRRKHSKAA